MTRVRLWSSSAGQGDDALGCGRATDRAQLAAEPLEFVVLGGQSRQRRLMTLLELGEFGVCAGEFAGEPLVARPWPGDPGLARVGLPAGSLGGGPPHSTFTCAQGEVHAGQGGRLPGQKTALQGERDMGAASGNAPDLSLVSSSISASPAHAVVTTR